MVDAEETWMQGAVDDLVNEMMEKYNFNSLKEGFNTLPGGEEIFYISNPALGLWAHRDRFER